MRFRHVQLAAAATRIEDQRAFYAQALEFPTRTVHTGFAVTVGETELEFIAADNEPFYHFALLVPGDRFSAAQTWIAERTTLLPHADRPEVVFEFPAWDAQALYFHDPAGNIVELIAHRELEPSGADGPFAPAELRGLSELGLVGRPTNLASPLTDDLGLALWDGRVADRDSLAFVGVKARTLILVPTGRGWLPTGRPAEPHPARIDILGAGEARCTLADGLYEISVASPDGSD